jgi:uncharacterized LabA/DUF88 family protein
LNITSKTDNLYLTPRPPYQTLYIYEIQGHFPNPKELFLDNFIACWYEADYSFLFFSFRKTQEVQEKVSFLSGLKYCSETILDYKNWETGSEFCPSQIGPFFLYPFWNEVQPPQDSIPKFYVMLDKLPKYEVRYGRLVFRDGEFEQKGVDTLLSIDIVNLSASGKISDAVLLAGDSDYIPAIKVVKDHGLNFILYHSKSKNCYHSSLWNICDERVPIDLGLIEKIKRTTTP